MSAKAFDRAAFGSQSARFTLNGVHPNLLATGRMPYDNKPAGSHLGPGSIDQLKYSEFSEESVARRADGPNWERAHYIEKLAKIPNLLYQETHKKKQEDKRRLGPGHYFADVFGGYQDLSKPQSNRGMLDALSDRFAYIKPNDNPGPFEYGIPDVALEEKRKNKPGNVPSFERSKESRSLPMVGCEVPPASYKHTNSIDELLKKKVSKRGPYDLFSEERSGPPKTGHFIPDSNPIIGPGSYEARSFVDNINEYPHEKHGKFGKNDQYPVYTGERLSINHVSLQPRYPKFPGPGYYDPADPSKVVSHPPPFLSSSIRDDKKSQKAFNHNYNKTGVGRYDMKRYDSLRHINSHKSLFLSKSAQITKFSDQKYNAERLRPVGLDNNEKLNLFNTGSIDNVMVTN